MRSEHTITIDTVTLKYYLYRHSNTPRPLIVLIHGLGSNHSRWTEFVETSALLEHWDILVPDMRGCGNSMVRCKINLEIWAHDLSLILQQENYAKAIFIGHSLGAHIALIFLSNYPDMVRGLVLIDPLSRDEFIPAFRRAWRMRWFGKLLTATIVFLNKLGFKRHHIPIQDLRALDIAARLLIEAGKEQEMIKRYSSPQIDLKYNPVANYFQYVYEILRPLPAFDNSETAILLLLSGKSSFSNGRSQHPLIGQFTQCTVKYVDCNHWLLTEKPRETRETIEAWLSAEFGNKSI